MEVTPYNGAQYFGLQPVPPKGKLDTEAFMRLLTVQLQHQNPLEPMNDRDFFAQMAQLGTVEGLGSMQKSLDIAQASNLMGKTVTAVRPMSETSSGQNELAQGVVKTLTLRNGEYYLGIQEANGGMVDVKMGSIQQVRM
jgi:flagellar basal-body rod modification protein FlgD